MSNIIPHDKINTSPRSTTSRLGDDIEFTLAGGYWCLECGVSLRACDAEPLDDGGMRLVCRECGHLILQVWP